MFQLGDGAFFLSNRDIQMGRGETFRHGPCSSRLVGAVLIRTYRMPSRWNLPSAVGSGH